MHSLTPGDGQPVVQVRYGSLFSSLTSTRASNAASLILRGGGEAPYQRHIPAVLSRKH